MESKRQTSCRSNSTNVYIQNHRSTVLKLLGKTARTQIILSPETPWTLYNYINLEDNTAYCAEYWWYTGTQNKTRKHPWHGTQGVIQYPTNRNQAQSLKENSITVIVPWLYNSLPKYLRDIESVKTEKFKLELDQFLELISWAQNAQICHCSRKQQHLRPANSSDGSRNLPRWRCPRLDHGAVLDGSKPLQVSKYPSIQVS